MSWNTIDSDPAVFTSLVEQLGVSGVQFEELYLIDSLVEFKPLYGIVFLFKYYSKDYGTSTGSLPLGSKYDESNEHLFFARQLIQNACGTQAVLNILLNRDNEVALGDELANFKSFTSFFDPSLKGETMTNSDAIRVVHNSFSTPNPFVDDEDIPDPNDIDAENDGLYHFIGYIEKNGHIYELDGLRPYPIDHGAIGENQDVYEKYAEVIQKKISTFKSDELRFSLLAVTSDKLAESKQNNDLESMEIESIKRRGWEKENALRRQDLIGLSFEMLKLVSSGLSDSEWEQLKNQGRSERERY